MATLRAATTLLRRGLAPRGARGLAQKPSWQDAALVSATQSIKGVGQVIFLDKPAQGNVVLAGLAYGDPALAVLAAVGGAGEGGAEATGPESNNTNTHSLAQTATHLNERNRGEFLLLLSYLYGQLV